MTALDLTWFSRWSSVAEAGPRLSVVATRAEVVQITDATDVDVATRYQLLSEAFRQRPHIPMDDDSVDGSLG